MGNPYRRPDRFSQKAKAEGYAARSVYKLEELDRRFHLLRRGQKVVDLGAAPGSWSKYVIERVGPGNLVGVDITPVDLPGGIFLTRSVFDVTTEELQALLGGPADVVLSDMAPLTMGARDADHYAQIELARRAFDVAVAILKPGGSFVCKVFEGQDAKAFELDVRKRFDTTKRARPEAVRQVSREFFLVSTGFLAFAKP
jgi:23S rRNA (uridine2552-2'-O)-methyltransferase